MSTTKKWNDDPAQGSESMEGSIPARQGGIGWWIAVPLLIALGLYLGYRKRPEDSAWISLQKGLTLWREGKWQPSVDLLLEAARLWETNAAVCGRIWNYIGVAYHQLGQYGMADQAYQTAILKNSQVTLAHYNRGVLHLQHGSLQEAIRELHAFVIYQPDRAIGWIRYGEALYRAGRYPEAEQAFVRAVQLAKSPAEQAEALNSLAVCLVHRGEYEGALKMLEAALRREPRFPAALWNRALIQLLYTGDRISAVQNLQVFLETSTNSQDQDMAKALTQRLAMELQPSLSVTETQKGAPAQVEELTNLFTHVGSIQPLPPPFAMDTQSNPPPASQTTTVAQATPPPATPSRTNPPTPEIAQASPSDTRRVSPTSPSEAPSSPPAPTSTSESSTSEPETESVPSKPLPSTTLAPTNQLAATSAPAPKSSPEKAITPAPSRPSLEKEPPSSPPQIAGLSPSPTNPPASSASPETKPAPQQPSPPPTPTPVEVVQVQETGPIQVGKPIASTPPTNPPVTLSPEASFPTNVPSTTPPSSESLPAVSGPDQYLQARSTPSTPPPKKESFFARLNPLRLFHRKKEEIQPTPIPNSSSRQSATTGPHKARQPAATPSPPSAAKPAPPTTPSWPRYRYVNPSPPPHGDRARALAILQQAFHTHQTGRLRDAIPLYEQATQVDPSLFEAHYNLALALFEERQYGRALAEYEKALAIRPEDPDARYNFALTLQQAGYPLDAAEQLQRLVKKHPNYLNAYLLLGNLYAQTLKDLPKAAEAYRRVLALDPNHPQAPAIRRWLSVQELAGKIPPPK